MARAAGLLGVLVWLALATPLHAQLSIPDYSPPKDMAAGFDPKALLGDAPKVQPPPDSWAAEVLKEKLWCGGIELGLAGGAGNSDVFKFRAGISAKRDADGQVMITDLMYVMSEVGGKLTENKALWVMRDELRMGKSNWNMLMSEAIEFDQFRPFNFRNAMHGGMSRTLVKNDRLLLKARMGSGMSYDLNTTTMNDRWVPEGMFGYDTEYKLSARVLLLSSGDYYPNMAGWGQFRLRIRAAGEFLIVPEFGLTLRAGIQERYDSAPGAGRPNDIDYFTTILMKF